MKPTELHQFLLSAIAARHPVLITGAPGIGKSDIVAQACAEAGADMILSHPVVADPTDAKGLPWVNEDHTEAVWLPFGDLARAVNAARLTVWHLDDMGQAPQATQASFMQPILTHRTVDGRELSEHVTFIACTNRRTDRAGVTGILEPVKSRFLTIVELVPDADDWVLWAQRQDWMPAEVIAFIRFRPDLLCKFEPTADMTNSPLPRTWAAVGRIMNLNLPDKVEAEAIRGAIGEAAATEFLAFLRLYRSLPSIDAILTDADTAPIPTEPSTLYAVVTALGRRANPKTFSQIARYAERLSEDGRGEFAALLVQDAQRNDPDVKNTTAFVRLATGEVGELIGGAAMAQAS